MIIDVFVIYESNRDKSNNISDSIQNLKNT